MGVEESFAERARRKRRERRLNWTAEEERAWLEAHPDDEPVLDVATPVPPDQGWDASLIPDVEQSEQSAESAEIDNFLDRLDIIDAYNRWSGKGVVSNPGNRREGVMIRCPDPAHPDHNPSAWINLDEQVYVCGGCGMQGGDKFMIAALHFGIGMPIPPDKFPELKKQMAEDLGYQVRKVGQKQYVQPMEREEPEPQPEQPAADPTPKTFAFPTTGTAADPMSQPPASAPVATVHSIVPEPDESDDAPPMPVLHWEPMIQEGTFLDSWMRDVVDYLPNEYYFFLGLMAIGLAVKNRGVVYDQPTVKGNLFICLTGPTGIGKSRTAVKLKSLLREALPSGDQGTGVKLLETPASGEALIDMFSEVDKQIVTAPTGETIEVIERLRVAGMVEFKELSELVSKSSRIGSTMKPILIEMFDASEEVSNTSRTHGQSIAREPFASLLSTTQPASIRNLLVSNDAESGFLNRWIFVGGTARKPDPFAITEFDPTPSVEQLKKIDRRFAHITQDDSAVRIHFDDDAKDLFREYFNSVIWPLKETEGTDLFSRIDLMIKKFAFLLAMDRGLKQIDQLCVRDAISLWEYAKQMYELIGSEIGIGEFDYCKRAVIKTINGFTERQKGKGPKPRQLVAAMNRDTRFPSDLIEKVVSHMVRMGEIEEASVQSPDGTVTMRYRLAS